MDTPTHYELLCVTPDATADDIRAAYRRLIRMYHPDVAGAAGEAMTLRLNNAQSALLDPIARAQYDRSRSYATAGASHPSYAPRPTREREHTQWKPQERPEPTPRANFTMPTFTTPPFRPKRYRAWLSVTVGSIAVLIALTIAVLVYSYSGPLELASPRVVPPLVIAIAWIVAGIRRPSKIFIALLVISSAFWPLSLAGVEPFTQLASVVPPVILALLTVVAVAVLALRVAAPQVIVLSRSRTTPA